MNYSMLRIMLKVLLTFILVVFFNSSAIAGGSFTFKWGKDSEPKQHQVKHKQKKGGPPAHAPRRMCLSFSLRIMTVLITWFSASSCFSC